jgi:ubiquinone/menaquinone biosynthesis C-methylase UbiE
MKSNWLVQQVLLNTEQWDHNLTTFYPEAKLWMSDSVSYFKHLTEVCNYLNAAKLIDWDSYLVGDSTVLDVGCGGGWLTGFLSKNPKIGKILAIDSSANYLNNYLPSVVSQSSGDFSKIETVQGLFSPILLDAESVDMVVISSALHHAESMSAVLSEFKRVLKPNAYLIILNEVPASNIRFLYYTLRAFVSIFVSVFFKKYKPHVIKISAGGYLHDPYLGDVMYPDWYWKKAICVSGFDLVELQDTNLPTISNAKGRSLKHFICRKKLID